MQTCGIHARFSFEADFCPNKTSRYGKCQHKNKRVTQGDALIAQSPKKTAMRGR